MPRKAARPPEPPDDDEVQKVINGFTKQLLAALEQFHDPAWLGAHSPLAAPYFLGELLESRPDAARPVGRGRALQRALVEAALALEGYDEQLTNSEQIEVVLRRLRDGSIEQHMLYWGFFEPRRIPISTLVDRLELKLSRPNYYHRLPKVIQQLGVALLRRTTPALRSELPPTPPTLIGREAVTTNCLHALSDGKTVALLGAGGVGKTALGAALVAACGRPTFWWTLRPGLNDSLGSLLFALSYFLHRQGSSVAWLQLVADDGVVNVELVQGVVLSELRRLSAAVLLCIDEIDLLRPGEEHGHDQICSFLGSLRGAAPLLLIGQRIPRHPQLVVDLPQPLDGLERGAFDLLLSQASITLSEAEREGLHSYTRGNARLLELFIGLYRTGVPLEQALDQMATAPTLDILLPRIVERLKPPERLVLRQLVVFRRPAPADAWGTPEEQAVLHQLVALHLAQRTGTGAVALLPAFRTILYHQLSLEEREVWHMRAATIRAERGEHTAAAYHYLQSGQQRMALWSWYFNRDEEQKSGQAEVALGILRQISTSQLAAEDREVLALARSELEQLVGRYDQMEANLASLHTTNDDLFAAQLERMRGHTATMRNEFDAAIAAYRHGLATVERLIGERAIFRKNLSWVAMRQKNLDDAWREACLARYEAENIQGYIQMELGNYAAAQRLYEGALQIAEQIPHQHGIAKTCDNLGRLLAIRGSFARSRGYAERALALFKQIGDSANGMGVLINQAMAANLARQPERALPLAREALEWFVQINEAWGQAAAAQNLAEAYLALGDLHQAEAFAQRVLASGEGSTLPDGLRVMGEVMLARGALAEAGDYVRQSIRIAEEHQDRYLAAYGWRSLVRVCVAHGHNDEGQTALDTAIRLFEELELPHEAERARVLLARQVG